MSWGGMLIFALLLSLITSAFEDFLWQIRHGSIPVVEGRRAGVVFLAFLEWPERVQHRPKLKIESIIAWYQENNIIIWLYECNNASFVLENVSTCPFSPGDNGWIDEWIVREPSRCDQACQGDHIVILGYDRSAIWMIEDLWWAKCRQQCSSWNVLYL